MWLRRSCCALSGLLLLCAVPARAADPPPKVEERPPPPQLELKHGKDVEREAERPPPERHYRRDMEKAEEIGDEVRTVVVNPEAGEDDASDWCDQLERRDDATLDLARRKLEELTCTTALWIDGRFGGLYHVDAARRTYGRLELSQYYSEYFGERFRVRFDVRAKFPNINRRLSGFFGRDDDEDFVRDRNERFALRSRFPQVEDQDEWLAGLGYTLPGGRSFRSQFRVGVRGIAHMRLFAQYRASYIPYSDDDNLVYLRATPFWNTTDGFGVTTGADFSHVISDTSLLRWANGLTRSERTVGADWRSAFIHYRALRNRRGLAYEAYWRGATGAPVSLIEYGVQTIFRHPMFERRLWGEWVIGYSWPRATDEEPRGESFNAGFALELPFGQKND